MKRTLILRLSRLVPVCVLTLCILCLSFAPAVQAQNASSEGVSASIDLVLNDTSLGSVLQIMADQSGKKLEAHAPLDEKVNVDLRGLGFEDAVARVLAGKPYMYAVDNETLHVFKGAGQPAPVTENVPVVQAPMQPQMPMVEPPKPMGSRIFLLKIRKAEEVVQLLAPLAKDVGLVPDVRTNAILLQGTEDRVAAVAGLAAQIDQMAPVRELEDKREFLSEVFSLEYVVDFKDLEDNLNLVLYGQKGAQSQQQTQAQNTNQQGLAITNEIPVTPVRKEYYLLDKQRRVLMITASRDKMEIIREYFARVNTPIPQVQIEAHIVAIDAGFERSLGINWNFQGGYSGPTRPTDRPLGTPQSTTGTALDPTQDFVFGKYNLSNLSAVLQSAESNNKGRILSQPRIMTLSGNEAAIQVGTKYPYKQSTTQNTTGTTENVQFIDVGIILNVTPQVNQKAKSIVMKLHPEVSDVIGFRNDAPIITTRQTDTQVEVNDGETVVIGGLLREENLRQRNDVPVLRDIPIIGEFFRFSKKSKGRTNLIILVTPKIMDPKGDWVNKPKPVDEPKIDPAKKYDRASRYKELLEKVRTVANSESGEKVEYVAPGGR